jgi:2-polyprenyl-6-methoxyphenol hydroxylase-like FAD-dependent oxidoreductase
VLEVLYKHIQDKGKILTSKRISRVEQSAHGVTVYCDDGTTFDGDLIAGADGVYSTVRQEMWRAADREEPGLIPEKEKKHMKAEYQVLYGISTATKGLPKGNYDVTYMKDQSSMFIVDKDDIVYWFIFKRMNKVHYFGDIPRYTKKEAEEFAADHANLNLETNGSVKFGDVWKNRTHYTLVATEEADFEHWTWGRFACLGDSVHK